MRLVEYPPPNIAVQSSEEIYKYAEELLDEVVKALTEPVTDAKGEATGKKGHGFASAD